LYLETIDPPSSELLIEAMIVGYDGFEIIDSVKRG